MRSCECGTELTGKRKVCKRCAWLDGIYPNGRPKESMSAIISCLREEGGCVSISKLSEKIGYVVSKNIVRLEKIGRVKTFMGEDVYHYERPGRGVRGATQTTCTRPTKYVVLCEGVADVNASYK